MQQLRRRGPELPGGCESGVVDQHRHPRREAVGDARTIGGVRQVGGQRLGMDTEPAGELIGQRDQPLLVAGDKHHVVSQRGVLASETATQTRGGTGDQRHGAHRIRGSHGWSAYPSGRMLPPAL
ncbi:Uncharacterised protein [Mycobacteroides abscessus subsp. massiliense]|nr:Uncharacterised protein [Mycobacteroides abscessus subsp. massiliense]